MNGSSLADFGKECFRIEFLFWFDGIVVSGEEKMRKPFPEFYEVLLTRYEISPTNALFIDDE